MEHNLVLGVELSKRAHTQHYRPRHGFNFACHTYPAEISSRGVAVGGAVGQSDGPVTLGAGRALANGCAGGCLPGAVYPVGYQHVSLSTGFLICVGSANLLPDDYEAMSRLNTKQHTETHRTHRIGWLRAAVLGANDGIVSTASLLIGIAAASAGQSTLLMTGVAALVAGAMSMAAGEYVSVYSQADTENADLGREKAELAKNPAAELRELTSIYVARGLTPELAAQVAAQLSTHDALGAHARDELGFSNAFSAKPLEAALASAASFATGAALPLAVAALAPLQSVMVWVAGTSLLSLAVLGVVAALAGGSAVLPSVWRVTFWGVLAMAVTAGVGTLFNMPI